MTDKDYSVTLSDDGRYVLCKITGFFTMEVLQATTREMEDLCKQHNIKCILNDVREATNVLNVMQNYEFAYKGMGKIIEKRDRRAAILAVPGDHTYDFVETVVQNAGYVIRVFHDETDALDWLHE